MDIIKEIEAIDPAAPNTNANKFDILTPHKIAVVMLVQQYLKVIENAKESIIYIIDYLQTKQSALDQGECYPAQTRRNFCMVLLKLIQHPDMSYKDLHNLLTSKKYEIYKAHWVAFEQSIKKLIKLGIEHLFDSFDLQNVMEKLLSEQNGVSQYGIVGLYIRRIVVTLDRMTFPEMMNLHQSIKLYYETGLKAIGLPVSHEDSSLSPEESAMDTELVYKDRNNFCKWSLKQAELFVAQQCSLLETHELRALPPIELDTKLKEIVNDNPLFSQAHFLNCLNNLRLRDYFNSLDALHRAFDRNPVRTLTPPETRGPQYSSLNLAILHASFNHNEEALTSLKESIMLAQELGDKHCLELANAWYCVLRSDKIKPSDKCIPDQSDLAMIQSVSLSIQFIIKIAARCGYKPSQLFELMLKSDELNCRNSLLELVANSLAQRTALWTLYGKNELGSATAQILLKLNKSWAFGDIGNSEGICQVLCSLALWLSIQGEFALCSVVLGHARLRFPRDPVARSWMKCECHVTISQAIYKGKWQEGMKACCQLYILDEVDSMLQRASLYIARRNLFVARKMLDDILSISNLESLIHVRTLILLAHTMIDKDNISAQVIQTLNSASVLSKEKYFEYEAAIIDMMLAHVLLNMRMPQQALEIVKNCMETILANGGIYDQAKTIFLFAKCLVESTNVKADKIQKMTECMDMVEKAIDYFKKLEAHPKVKDVYIYLAKFYNEVQMISDRNKFACKFKQYDEEFPTPVEYLNVFF